MASNNRSQRNWGDRFNGSNNPSSPRWNSFGQKTKGRSRKQKDPPCRPEEGFHQFMCECRRCWCLSFDHRPTPHPVTGVVDCPLNHGMPQSENIFTKDAPNPKVAAMQRANPGKIIIVCARCKVMHADGPQHVCAGLGPASGYSGNAPTSNLRGKQQLSGSAAWATPSPANDPMIQIVKDEAARRAATASQPRKASMDDVATKTAPRTTNLHSPTMNKTDASLDKILQSVKDEAASRAATASQPRKSSIDGVATKTAPRTTNLHSPITDKTSASLDKILQPAKDQAEIRVATASQPRKSSINFTSDAFEHKSRETNDAPTIKNPGHGPPVEASSTRAVSSPRLLPEHDGGDHDPSSDEESGLSSTDEDRDDGEEDKLLESSTLPQDVAALDKTADFVADSDADSAEDDLRPSTPSPSPKLAPSQVHTIGDSTSKEPTPIASDDQARAKDALAREGPAPPVSQPTARPKDIPRQQSRRPQTRTRSSRRSASKRGTQREPTPVEKTSSGGANSPIIDPDSELAASSPEVKAQDLTDGLPSVVAAPMAQKGTGSTVAPEAKKSPKSDQRQSIASSSAPASAKVGRKSNKAQKSLDWTSVLVVGVAATVILAFIVLFAWFIFFVSGANTQTGGQIDTQTGTRIESKLDILTDGVQVQIADIRTSYSDLRAEIISNITSLQVEAAPNALQQESMQQTVQTIFDEAYRVGSMSGPTNSLFRAASKAIQEVHDVSLPGLDAIEEFDKRVEAKKWMKLYSGNSNRGIRALKRFKDGLSGWQYKVSTAYQTYRAVLSALDSRPENPGLWDTLCDSLNWRFACDRPYEQVKAEALRVLYTAVHDASHDFLSANEAFPRALLELTVSLGAAAKAKGCSPSSHDVSESSSISSLTRHFSDRIDLSCRPRTPTDAQMACASFDAAQGLFATNFYILDFVLPRVRKIKTHSMYGLNWLGEDVYGIGLNATWSTAKFEAVVRFHLPDLRYREPMSKEASSLHAVIDRYLLAWQKCGTLSASKKGSEKRANKHGG